MEWVVAGGVFLVIVLVLAYAIVRYRARPGRQASQDTEHPRVEAVYAIVLLAAAGVIVGYTAHQNSRDFTHRSPAYVVDVTGYQWCWQFRYAGTTTPTPTPTTSTTASCLDGDYPTLVLPVGQPVQLRLTSADVIHAFWLPDFRFKRDVFPDHTNTFVLTINRPGSWLGHCAEFCGLRHAHMLFRVRALPADQFRSWLAAQSIPTGGAA
jgi:cytochrome c oxidase subunit 2